MTGDGQERSPGAVLIAVLLGLAAVAFSALHPRLGDQFWCDDAFITFRHVRHLFEGQGLVFNAGETVEGYTNFLWGMIAYAGMHLGVEPIQTASVVAWVAQFFTVLMVYSTGRRLGVGPRASLIAPALLLVNVGFLTYPTTGMETSFHIFLAAAVVRAMVGEQPHTVGWSLALGGLWLLLGLNRFDGFVLVGIFIAWQILFRREIKATIPALLVFAIGLLAYNAWRYSYYGLPLPNTAYAKTSFNAGRAWEGAKHVGGFAAGACGMLALAAVPFTVRKGAAGVGLFAWLAVCQAGYVVMVGGDWMPYHRFLLPAVPALCLAAQHGCVLMARGVAAAEADGQAPQGSSAVLKRPGVSVPGFLLAGAVVLGTSSVGLVEAWRSDFTGPGRHFDEHEAKLIGENLHTVIPEDKLVAIEWAGIVPYYSQHAFLDTFGLTDREFVQSDLTRTKWGVWVTPMEIAKRRPDAIIFCARVFPSEMHARLAVKPGGPCHYGRYMGMTEPDFPYEFAFPEVAPGKFWPVLLRVDRG